MQREPLPAVVAVIVVAAVSAQSLSWVEVRESSPRAPDCVMLRWMVRQDVDTAGQLERQPSPPHANRPVSLVLMLVAALAPSTATLPRTARADSGPARTADPTSRPLVVLVRPSPADTTLAEAMIRIHGELVEGGFGVAMVDGSDDVEPRVAIETAGQSLRPAVTIGFFGRSTEALELWIADRLTGKLVVRRLGVRGEQGSRASEVLAVRAAELLRASLMELLVLRDRGASSDAGNASRASPATASGAPPRASTDVSATNRSATSPPSPEPANTSPLPAIERWATRDLLAATPASRWGFELGAAVLGSFEGLGPAVLPLLRAQVKLGEHLRLRGTAAGLGTRPNVQASSGSAAVSQVLLLLEGVYRPVVGASIAPQLSLGGGALRFGVEGDTSWPYRPVANSRWSAAVDAGAGCVARLHPNIEAALEAHAVFAEPYPAVQLFDDIAARAGRPTWLLSLTLSGWL